jgi:hypothetical protein
MKAGMPRRPTPNVSAQMNEQVENAGHDDNADNAGWD